MEIQKLERGFVGRHVALRFQDLPEVPVEGFDGVGRVDCASDFRGEREERRDLLPSRSPRGRDGGESCAVLFLERVQGTSGVVGVGGRVDLAELGALILFLDETGLRLIPHVGRTWAKKGRAFTPVLMHRGHWTKINVIAAISRSGKLYFQTQLKDFTGPTVVGFLRHLLRATRRRLIIVWDNGRVHRNNVVKRFLGKNATRIEAHFLPPYAFELMPVEGFNGQLKVHEMKNHTAKDTRELHQMVRRKARRIQRNRRKCRRFWGQTPLLDA